MDQWSSAFKSVCSKHRLIDVTMLSCRGIILQGDGKRFDQVKLGRMPGTARGTTLRSSQNTKAPCSFALLTGNVLLCVVLEAL